MWCITRGDCPPRGGASVYDGYPPRGKASVYPGYRPLVTMKDFFAGSDVVDHMVVRPLSHIRANWELTWDPGSEAWCSEEDSYADAFNVLIDDLDRAQPPSRYHDNEDCLAEYVKAHLKWAISKVGGGWVGAEYSSILEQGGFGDLDQGNLVLAAAGRIHAARKRQQHHFDDMEESHQRMLAAVLCVILYHRSDGPV